MPLLESVIETTSALERVEDCIWSVLPPGERAADYDRIAASYDLVVGNTFYNRLVWGNWARHYSEAAERFLADAPEGPLLDCGCGSLVFTGKTYRQSAALGRLVLMDRSLGMLRRGAKRAQHGKFLQADAMATPFKREVFAGVMSWGILHVFGTHSPFLGQLKSVSAGGASIAISTLVLANRPIGDRMLRLLHQRGEIAMPETEDQICSAFERLFEITRTSRRGNMMMLEGRIPD
jgi:ubiquinone/menaquinone biosynthesis C-methylase UbiE